VRDVLAGIERGFARLAAADMTALTGGEQLAVLRTLESVDGMRAAVRGRAGAVFEAGGGPDEHGFGGLASCVQGTFRITRGKAGSYKRWARRCRAHPQLMDALARGVISESWAEQLMTWTGTLKDPALTARLDGILLAGAMSGLELADLRGLYEEARALAAAPDQDGPEPPDRSLDLATTLGGAGVLRGQLTPQCCALLQAGLEAYAKRKAGADDDRTYGERAHDALVQLLKLALRSGEVPRTGGQDTTAIVHLPLHELRQLDGASAIETGWGQQMHPGRRRAAPAGAAAPCRAGRAARHPRRGVRRGA
jgi:hypothetical protein